MRHLCKAVVFLGIFAFLISCQLASQVTPMPIPSPSESSAFGITFPPSQTATATATLEATPTRAFVPPTLIPTLDPTSVPALLRALSVHTLEGMNGHNIRQIMGWNYGFRQDPCCGYEWLDPNHLLLYPRTGEGTEPYMDGSRRIELSSQPVISNLESGYFWQPRSNISTSIYVAPKLGIVFLQEAYGSATGPTMPSVITYTFDGQEITRYWGKILGVSPSGEKILVDDDTVIDLRTNKVTDLAWHMDYDLGRSSKLYWSSDETRLYQCCFYFADLRTGRSYNFEWSDLRGANGKPVSDQMHAHVDGQWVLNDRYFLVKWDYWSAWSGDPVPLFSPMDKEYYDLAKLAGIPSSCIGYSTYTVSPNGMYVWVKCSSIANGEIVSFLVDLTTFESTSYNVPINDFFWSPDSKFGWTDGLDTSDSYVLSVASKKLLPIPVNPRYEDEPVWHFKDPILAYTENDQTLILLNAKDMSIEKWKSPIPIMGFGWSVNGDRVRFIAKDRSIWQVDYPMFQNLEQLTEPVSDIHQVFWSPDGKSISFISGSDIYVVDTIK